MNNIYYVHTFDAYVLHVPVLRTAIRENYASSLKPQLLLLLSYNKTN